MSYADDWPSIPPLDPDLFDRPLTDQEFQRLAAMPNVSPSSLSARCIAVQAEIRANPQLYDPPPSCKLAVAYLAIAGQAINQRSARTGSLGVRDWKQTPTRGSPYLVWLANAPPLAGVRRELAQLEFRWPNLSREARQNALLDFAQMYVDWPAGAGDLIKVCAVQIGPAKRTRLQ